MRKQGMAKFTLQDLTAMADTYVVETVMDFKGMGALAKRPEERLSDFDKMDELLGGSGTPSAEVRPYSDDRSTDVLSIRYPVSQAERISQAISDLSRDLSDVEEVEISHASLRPLTGGAGATQRPGSAARPTQPTAAMDTLVD